MPQKGNCGVVVDSFSDSPTDYTTSPRLSGLVSQQCIPIFFVLLSMVTEYPFTCLSIISSYRDPRSSRNIWSSRSSELQNGAIRSTSPSSMSCISLHASSALRPTHLGDAISQLAVTINPLYINKTPPGFERGRGLA